MAARTPRRAFTAPFVMTLATALPACGGMRTTNPPGPPTPSHDRVWTVTRTDAGTDCTAQESVSCPNSEPGCAQPAPTSYACPLGADGQPDTALQWPVTVHLLDGQTECYADRPAQKCPEGAGGPDCKTLPLYVVPCPS